MSEGLALLTLSSKCKEQLAAAREELKNQTPNREVVGVHIDTAETLLDALLETMPVETDVLR